MLGEETKPGAEHSQIRFARPCGAGALHQVVPLIERHDELVVRIQHQPLVAWPTRWVGEVRLQPEGRGPIQAAELAARTSLRPHSCAATGYVPECVSDKPFLTTSIISMTTGYYADSGIMPIWD